MLKIVKGFDDILYFSEVKIVFSKRQGTGNDFIIINNFDGRFSNINHTTLKFLCDRKFGIGADGVILINPDSSCDFNMVFYNPDGSQSFCGNGARCAVSFFIDEICKPSRFVFSAIDGDHEYILDTGLIGIKMRPVQQITSRGDDFVLNTGSPHFVRFSEDITTEKILEIGKEIRYSSVFKSEGINVNLLRANASHEISVATYERGVENETLSCGTGATATALVWAEQEGLSSGEIKVNTKGGPLHVSFSKKEKGFDEIWLKGPAMLVFNGEITLTI